MSKAATQRRILVTFALSALAMAVIVWYFRPVERPIAVILPEQPRLNTQPPSLVDRVPMSWSWFWRARDAIFPRKRVSLKTTLVELGELQSVLPAGAPVLSTNDVRVWILGTPEMENLQERLIAEQRTLLTSRTDTADEIGTMVTTGAIGPTGNGEMLIEYYPEVSRRAVDLSALFRVTSRLTNEVAGQQAVTVLTNLSLLAQLQLLDNQGAFLVKESERGAYGIMVSVTLPKVQKK